MTCPAYQNVKDLLVGIDKVTIEKFKENPLRFDVWGTSNESLKQMVNDMSTASLTEGNRKSVSVLDKLNRTFKRMGNRAEKPKKFVADLINHESANPIASSIALYEMMEAVKGESDKARNEGFKIEQISSDKILPNLPLSRIAAVIGRKILYQQGFRVKNTKENKKTPVDVEALYHLAGMNALEVLKTAGYVEFSDDTGTIKDYITPADENKINKGGAEVTKKAKSVYLNTKTLGIKANTDEALYFLLRQKSDLKEQQLASVVDILSAIRQVTQPADFTPPDKEASKTEEEFRESDTPKLLAGETLNKVRKELYEKPLRINKAVHAFMSLLHTETLASGIPASKIIKKILKDRPELAESLFGIKDPGLNSVDKQESVIGQNLSKSTAIDDIAEYYDLLTENGAPAELHFPLKNGRNVRLYYLNSILNPHASKQSRYMLTPGNQEIEAFSDDLDYLVYHVAETLGSGVTYDQLVNGTDEDFELALKKFDNFNKVNTSFEDKISALSWLSSHFEGVDYVSILTGLQAVKDVRNPVNGKINTEFAVSSDATASGGTLTFFQALGTNGNIKKFLQRLGILVNDEGKVELSNADIYSLMSESVQDYVKTEFAGIAPDPSSKEVNVKGMIEDTLKLLFNDGKNIRGFSKAPTMTFVYQQGEEGSKKSIAASLADRIFDTFRSKDSRAYLDKLFENSPEYNGVSFSNMSYKQITSMEGLYDSTMKAIIESGVPSQIHTLLEKAVKTQYIGEYQTRSKDIFELIKLTSDNNVIKILPADAVLDGKKPSTDLAKFGMPVAKVFEIMHTLPDGTEVLTRKEILHKTIADVSAIHGIDAALLYHAINSAGVENGVVVVHDEVRGTVKDVRKVEKAYALEAKKVLETYDIHEQLLESLKMYYPKIADNSVYKTLAADVAKSVAEKKALIKDFNDDTSALIGNGDKHLEFKGESTNNTTNTETAVTTEKTTEETTEVVAKPDTAMSQAFEKAKKAQPKPETKAQEKSQNAAETLINELGRESDIISKFSSWASTYVVAGDKFSYNSSSDEITVNLEEKNKSKMIEAVEHEVIHAVTLARISQGLKGVGDKNTLNDIKYFQKTLAQLRGMGRVGSKETQERLQYVFAQTSEELQVAEFIAIMGAEKKIADDVYNAIGSKENFKTRVQEFLKSVQEFIANFISDKDLEDSVNAAKLYGAVQRTIDNGFSDRRNKQEETIKVLKNIDSNLGFNKPPNATGIDYLNQAVSRMLMDRSEEAGKTVLKNIHKGLINYPIYSDVINKIQGVYDSSEAFQQLIHTITGEGVDKDKKAVVLAEFAKTTAQREDFVRQNLAEFGDLTSAISKEDKATLDTAITQISLHDYYVQAKELNTVESIDAEVVRLEENLKNTPQALKDVEDLVNLNVRNTITGNIYNLDNYTSKDSPIANDVRKLLALKSIQAVGTEKFVSLISNKELSAKLQDMTIANYLSLEGIGGRENHRTSGVPHRYSEVIQQRAINLDELSSYEYGDNSGWVIVEKPTKTSLGLVYRQVIDSTSIPGAFTDVKMSTADISVDRDRKEYSNVLSTPNGYKMILTDAQRKKMGAESPVQSLVRSTAHSLSIQESEIIRNLLLEKETNFELNKNNMSDLNDIIADKSKDNPWFLNAGDLSYDNLSAEAKAKYKPVGNRVSDVKGFSDKVTYVRKDISHWLLGGDSNSPFTNPKYKWGLRITKNLISMSKIGIVILNPGKIARDNISNISYLGVMGVSPNFAYENYKNIMEDYGVYTEDKNKLLNLKVRLVSSPDDLDLKAKAKALKAKLKSNPISSIEDKGFLNSLGSALISRESETLGGTQKDIDTALTYLLKNKKGNNNYVSHFLMQLQKAGFEGETFLNYLGGIVGKVKAGKELESELDKVSTRLSQIRSDKDMVAYASQFINAPQSEAVRFGASITDLTDVMAKETYYRYLVKEGMDEQKAKIKVLDSFPNYVENMPLNIQQLSDVGILMFPSFWLRIQKVIYRMAKEKPLSLATEEAIDIYLNGNVDTILDANIVTKATSWSGIAHSPAENIGFGSVLPLHLF